MWRLRSQPVRNSLGRVATQVLSEEPGGGDARGGACTWDTGQGAWSGAYVKGLVFLAPTQLFGILVSAE